MANKEQPNKANTTDEIDLGQLLELIKKGLHSLGIFFLRIFIYLRNNAFKLIGLVVIGVGISFGLSQIISKKLKTDVIVRPNFDSKDYLYDVVDEISSNLATKNESFFVPMSIQVEDLAGFQIFVEAIEQEKEKTEDAIGNEMKYLELLQNFKDERFVIDILRSEISEKSVLNHKITFQYKDAKNGPAVVEKLMNYVNANTYFNELKGIYKATAASRISKNELLIDQIDVLINNYSNALLADKRKADTGVVYMEKENTLNIPSLLNLKNTLLKEIEDTRIEAVEQTAVISILNFGKTQEVSKSLFKKTYFLIPSVLVIGFLLLSLLKYLNLKSKELE